MTVTVSVSYAKRRSAIFVTGLDQIPVNDLLCTRRWMEPLTRLLAHFKNGDVHISLRSVENHSFSVLPPQQNNDDYFPPAPHRDGHRDTILVLQDPDSGRF